MKSVPSSRGKAFLACPHRPCTPPILVKDRERVRAFLDADPIGNAVVWDRVFHQDGYEAHVDRDPPSALLAIQRSRRPDGASFIALHARDAASAGVLCDLVPSGLTVLHATEEFPLALLEPRAKEFHPHSAWLFRLDPDDFVDQPDPRVRPLRPEWAGRVARLWQPEWTAEDYVRRRIEAGPTAAIEEEGALVAWALTHMITDRVGVIGMVHVVEGFRRKGLARSVVASVSRDLLRQGKVPTLHAFVDNAASLALFPTLGFRRVKRQVWGDAVFR